MRWRKLAAVLAVLAGCATLPPGPQFNVEIRKDIPESVVVRFYCSQALLKSVWVTGMGETAEFPVNHCQDFWFVIHEIGVIGRALPAMVEIQGYSSRPGIQVRNTDSMTIDVLWPLKFSRWMLYAGA